MCVTPGSPAAHECDLRCKRDAGGDTGSTGDGAGRQKTKPSINFLRWQVTSLNRRKVFSSSNLDGRQSPTLCSPQGPNRPSRGKGQGQRCPPEHPPVQRIGFESSMMPPNLYSVLPVACEVVDRHPRHLILTALHIGKAEQVEPPLFTLFCIHPSSLCFGVLSSTCPPSSGPSYIGIEME